MKVNSLVQKKEEQKKQWSSINRIDYIIFIGTFLLMFGAVFLVYGVLPYFPELHIDNIEPSWRNALMIFSILLILVKASFLLYSFVLYLRYKPIPSVSDDQLPTCTVIVPAYNEGKLVYDTLLSLAENDYPLAKIQILAIDDGSQDDTWEWMKKAKNDLGERIEIFQQPENKGKRHALYRGFHLGIGEVFITVDSDSVVEKNTLRLMTSPFVKNKKCGAVAGNVKVLNNQSAIIPRMLNASFIFSFEFVRSAQSSLGSVLCTPGALSAYRKESVMNCLEEWIHQKFMGQPSDIGEDRAMTNMILKQGYHVLFQKHALVLTNVPEHYKNLYKMFIRWERSNVRENIMMSQFAFSKFREGPRIGTQLLLLNQWFKVLMAYPLILLMLALTIAFPLFFISSMLIGILVFSSVQFFFCAKKHSFAEAIWTYPYSIFYAFTLFWITPYAIATAHRRGWLTREI